MRPAADVMEEAIKKVEIKKPCVDVISNVTAKPVSFICMKSPLFNFYSCVYIVRKCRRNSTITSPADHGNCTVGTQY